MKGLEQAVNIKLWPGNGEPAKAWGKLKQVRIWKPFVTAPDQLKAHTPLGSGNLGRQWGYSRILWAEPSTTVLPNQIELASGDQVASFGGYAVQRHTQAKGVSRYSI